MVKLYPHQALAVKESRDKWGLWFRQRVGKTAPAICLANERCKSALIISPKQIKNKWINEVVVWGNGICDFKVISKEDIRLGKNVDKREAILVDEAHMAFGNYKSQTYKALYKYIQDNQIKYVWLLTGTPMTASNWCVYSYAKLLGINYNWKKWQEHFNFPIKMGNRIIWQPKKGMENELQRILKSMGTVIDLKDITYVAEDEETIESFALNLAQKKLIKEMFDPMPIVRYGRQWQLESGVLKSDGYRETISIPCDKDKRLIELVKDTEKIIIVCRYHDQIDKYIDILRPLGREIYEISGRVKRTAADIAPEAENDPSAIVIIQAETYAGYDLKSFNTMVFASMSYSFVAYDQVCSRIKAIGKTTPCEYIYFITEGDSLDRAVYESVKKKQDFSIELYKK